MFLNQDNKFYFLIFFFVVVSVSRYAKLINKWQPNGMSGNNFAAEVITSLSQKLCTLGWTKCVSHVHLEIWGFSSEMSRSVKYLIISCYWSEVYLVCPAWRCWIFPRHSSKWNFLGALCQMQRSVWHFLWITK